MPITKHPIEDDGWAGNVSGRRWRDKTPLWFARGTTALVFLLALTTLLTPPDQEESSMTELTLEVDQRRESHQWWQSDVDPIFNVDGELFAIEPAAAPPCETERQSCCAASLETLACCDNRRC